ncbi:MAG: single-stranded DNA-binding protein [Actinomycetales bacterium]|nr:single-stranded DNA-binding protein [Actinomycetales bacterium]
MNDIHVTVVGNVATDIAVRTTASGRMVSSFRVASNARRFDRATSLWVDAEPSFVSVSCWGALADHVAASVAKGDPVLVTGRLRIRQWQDGEQRGTSADLDAASVGHDLTRGTTRFERARSRSAEAENTDPWAESARAA